MNKLKNRIREYSSKGVLTSKILAKIKEPHFFHSKLAKEIEIEQRLSDLYRRKYRNVLKNKNIDTAGDKSDYVWICWFQGEDKAPELVRACINSVRYYLGNKKIIVIDSNNMKEYIEFPDFILDRVREGLISFAHFSDLIRTELLCKYGGLWLDATVLCTGKEMLKEFEQHDMFLFKRVELERNIRIPSVASSWLIYARVNDPILLKTRELLYEYWKNNKLISNYYLWHIMFALATDCYKEKWENVISIPNQLPHLLQFELADKYDESRWRQFCVYSDFHKLNRHLKFNEEDNFYNMIIRHNGVIAI